MKLFYVAVILNPLTWVFIIAIVSGIIETLKGGRNV